MAKKDDEKPRGRFSKSGHTSHGPRGYPSAQPPLQPPPQYPPPQPPPQPPNQYPPPQPPHQQQPQYPPPQYPQQYPPQQPPLPYQQPQYPPPYYEPPQDPFGRPTLHRAPGGDDASPAAAPSSPAVALTKAAIGGTNRAARLVTRKVISASKADGAHESGLTALIWNQVLSYGTDAMITIALAGTVFFGASSHAQRGNVLLYLVITMAPFAVVAPIIGPLLDRFQHGRRWTMAATAIGRAVLALVMASHPTELLVLYPCALGSLVLSKAYSVVRAAAAPRLVPPGLTLTEANARLSIFGLGSTIVLGGGVGVLIKLSGSYKLGLTVTAIGFAVCAFFAFRLPPQIDSAFESVPHPQEPDRPLAQRVVPPLMRLQTWARRGFSDHLILALQGESTLRYLSGLLTIYMAFFVENTQHGVTAAWQLGAVVGAAGFGNFAGTAIGTKLRLVKPELIIVASVVIAAASVLLCGVIFSITFAVIGMFVTAVANSLSKIGLDALIQRDIVETQRSSAFARSETFLQLAWVLGAAFGVLLPVTHGGGVGFIVGGAVVGTVAVVVVMRYRVLTGHDGRPHTAPGTVSGREQHPF